MPLTSKQKNLVKKWQNILDDPDNLDGMPKYEAEELLALYNELKDPDRPELSLWHGSITDELAIAAAALLDKYKSSDWEPPKDIEEQVSELSEYQLDELKLLKEQFGFEDPDEYTDSDDDENYKQHDYIRKQVNKETEFRDVMEFLNSQYSYFQHIFDPKFIAGIAQDSTDYALADKNPIDKFMHDSAGQTVIKDFMKLLRSVEPNAAKNLCINFALINSNTSTEAERITAETSLRNTLMNKEYRIVEHLLANKTQHREDAIAFREWMIKQNAARDYAKSKSLQVNDARKKTVANFSKYTLTEMYDVIKQFYEVPEGTMLGNKPLANFISRRGKEILKQIPVVNASIKPQRLQSGFPYSGAISPTPDPNAFFYEARYVVWQVAANLVTYYQELISNYRFLLDKTDQNPVDNLKFLNGEVEKLNKLPVNGFTDHIIYSLGKLIEEYQEKINITAGSTPTRVAAVAKAAAVAPMQSGAPTRADITTSDNIKLPQKPKSDLAALQKDLATIEQEIQENRKAKQKIVGKEIDSSTSSLQTKYTQIFNNLSSVKQLLYKIPDVGQIPSTGSKKPATPVTYCQKIMDLFFGEADKIVGYMMDYLVNVGKPKIDVLKAEQKNFYNTLDDDLNKCLEKYVESILNLAENSSDVVRKQIIYYFIERTEALHEDHEQELINLYNKAGLPIESPQLDIGPVNSLMVVNDTLQAYLQKKYLPDQSFDLNEQYKKLGSEDFPWFKSIRDPYLHSESRHTKPTQL